MSFVLLIIAQIRLIVRRMNCDIGPFSIGSTQKVTWVSFGEFHDNTDKIAHDKTHPVYSVLCCTNVQDSLRTYCTS